MPQPKIRVKDKLYSAADIVALDAENQRMVELTTDLYDRIEGLKAALPDVEKLRLLADWLDLQDAKAGRDGVEVQLDLRRWANAAEDALKGEAE